MAENKPVHPRLQPITHQYLEDLVKTGAYGSNPTDVARTLIEQGIRQALADDLIEVRRATKTGA